MSDILCYQFHDSCKKELLYKLIDSLKYTLRLYLIAHGGPTLVYKYKELFNYPLKVLKDLAWKICRSSLFLGGYTVLCRIVLCSCYRIFDPFNRLSVILLGGISGMSIIFESLNRIKEYNVFLIPRIIEGFWDLFAKIGYVKPVPNGDKIIFGFSMAVVLVLYKYKKNMMAANYQKLIGFFFGKEKLQMQNKELEKENLKLKNDNLTLN